MEAQNTPLTPGAPQPEPATSPVAADASAQTAPEPAMAPAADDTLEFDYPQIKPQDSIIKVVGVGGGGGNAVQHMYADVNIQGVSYLIINTDKQALIHNKVPHKLAIAELGAGGDPEVARLYAEEQADEIRTALNDGTRMVFITAGEGGGTGTGASPVVARIAKELGILTIGIVTIPFSFEGVRQIQKAFAGVDRMRQHVDSLIVVNNDKLIQCYPDLNFSNGLAFADDTLAFAAKSISDIITKPAYINVDFADVKTTLKDSDVALISSGRANGEKRVTNAIRKAIKSPLLLDNDISEAKHLLFEICYSNQMPVQMHEIGEFDEFKRGLNPEILVIWGARVDDDLGDDVEIIVLASGFKFEKGMFVHERKAPAQIPGDADAALHAAAEEARRKAAEEEDRRKAAEEERRKAAEEEERRKKIEQAQQDLMELQQANKTLVKFGIEPKPIPAKIRELLQLDDEAATRLMLPEEDRPTGAQPADGQQTPADGPKAGNRAPTDSADDSIPTKTSDPALQDVAKQGGDEQGKTPAQQQSQDEASGSKPGGQPAGGGTNDASEGEGGQPADGGIEPAESIDDGIERIRLYYGDEVANRARMDQVRSRYFILDDEDLSNEALIAELEKLPAYMRSSEDRRRIMAHRDRTAGSTLPRTPSADGSIPFE